MSNSGKDFSFGSDRSRRRGSRDMSTGHAISARDGRKLHILATRQVTCCQVPRVDVRVRVMKTLIFYSVASTTMALGSPGF